MNYPDNVSIGTATLSKSWIANAKFKKKSKKKFKKIQHFFQKKICQGAHNREGCISDKSIVCNVTGFVYKIIIVKKNNCKK